MKYRLFIILLIFSTGLKAQNEILEKVLNQANIGIDSFYNPYKHVNTMWNHGNNHYFNYPLDSERIVYVVPIVSEIYDANSYELDNHILVADKNGKLLDHLCEHSRWTSDAYCLWNIKIKDKYIINDSTIALGIEHRMAMEGWVLGERNELSIYSIESKGIRKILTNFPIFKLNGEPVGLPEDKPYNRTLTREIRILSTKTNGFYDIEVKNTVEKTENWKDEGDPKNNSIQILKYDKVEQLYK